MDKAFIPTYSEVGNFCRFRLKTYFFMRDKISIYGGEGADDAAFTRKRVDRDTHIDSDGFRLHAGVNGSLCIMRKKYPLLCRGISREDVATYITVGCRDFYSTVA